MTDKSQRPKGRDGVLSSLNMAIDGLNLAKEVSSITPAKAIFGSVSILLTMIRVSFLFCDSEVFRAHAQSGRDGQRTGLRRARALLRRYLPSPRPGDEWKETRRPQQICVRRDKSIDDVSRTDDKHELFHQPRYRLQDCRGNPREGHQAERKAQGLSIPPCEQR